MVASLYDSHCGFDANRPLQHLRVCFVAHPRFGVRSFALWFSPGGGVGRCEDSLALNLPPKLVDSRAGLDMAGQSQVEMEGRRARFGLLPFDSQDEGRTYETLDPQSSGCTKRQTATG